MRAMQRKQIIGWLLGLALLALIAFVPIFDKSGSLGATMINAIKKGSKVTHSSDDDGDGVIDQAPATLAESASLDLETYTLARAISSEEGNSATIRQAAVGCVMMNNARNRDGIYSYATGGQGYGHQGGVRKVSTWLDPYTGHVELAQKLMSGEIGDITNGATNFFGPASQDKLHEQNPDKFRSALEVHAKWTAGGLTEVRVEGIDPSVLRFYA